jgi:hypothetical protein
MSSDFGVDKIFVELFVFEAGSPVYSPPGSLSEGLKIIFSIMGSLPVCRSSHSWFIFFSLTVPLKAFKTNKNCNKTHWW